MNSSTYSMNTNGIIEKCNELYIQEEKHIISVRFDSTDAAKQHGTRRHSRQQFV